MSGLEDRDEGGVGWSSLEDLDPEDRVETRLTGRSEESDGVADGARSLLLMEVVERRGDSKGEGGVKRMVTDSRRSLNESRSL